MKGKCKTAMVFCAVVLRAAAASAEFGVSAGSSFNYQSGFRTRAEPQRFARNPGGAVAGVDHFYDDGYNRVDNTGNERGLTSFWGYESAAQADAGLLTMNSSRSVIDQQRSSGSESELQTALEIYWQHDLTDNERWNGGVRVALRWQSIEIDDAGRYRTTIETISDAYSYNGTLPGAPFDGGFAGANFQISDTPQRTIAHRPGGRIHASRDLDADLTALDLGPTLSFNFTENLRIVLCAGGTLGWINSDFSYRDAPDSAGSDRADEWLLGVFAGADLQYRLTESWGIFAGAAHSRLEDFSQSSNGRSAELQFDNSYTLRTGLFYR